jgi:hypothetical protein
MTAPLTASTIAALAFQKFIEGSAGELTKRFMGDVIDRIVILERIAVFFIAKNVFT